MKPYYEDKGDVVYHGNCLEVMPVLPDKSIDMILCDLPYGTTACKWDTIIPFEPLWAQYKRIIKDNGAIVLTASQPFTTILISSNIHNFRYCWIWNKKFSGSFVQAKRMPMRIHEDVCVFSYNGKTPAYFPQKTLRDTPVKSGGNKQGDKAVPILGSKILSWERKTYTDKFPETILFFPREVGLHPTQKPVALFEYLIRTYTNEGDTVLDNCCGSGTTGLACKNTGRKSIQIEQKLKYVEIAINRLSQGVLPL